MIEAVTYGMIPSANSENLDSAEPENVFRSAKMPEPRPPLEKKFSIDCESTPGAGIHEPRR